MTPPHVQTLIPSRGARQSSRGLDERGFRRRFANDIDDAGRRRGAFPRPWRSPSALVRPPGESASPSSRHHECDRRGNTRGNLEAADGDGIRSRRSRGPKVPADNFPPSAPPRRSARDCDKRISSLPRYSSIVATSPLNLPSRSRIRYWGARSSGKAPRSCCTIQAPVGCSVTLKCKILRRGARLRKSSTVPGRWRWAG